MDAEPVRRPPVACPAEAGLDLVDDQQDAVLVGQSRRSSVPGTVELAG